MTLKIDVEDCRRDLQTLSSALMCANLWGLHTKLFEKRFFHLLEIFFINQLFVYFYLSPITAVISWCYQNMNMANKIKGLNNNNNKSQ